MSTPDSTEKFYVSSGEAGLELHYNDRDTRYWVFAGQAALEIKEDDLYEMADLLSDFKKERLENTNSILRWISIVLFIVVVVIIVLIL